MQLNKELLGRDMVDSRHALGAKQDPVVERGRCGGQGGAQHNSQLLCMHWVDKAVIPESRNRGAASSAGKSFRSGWDLLS